MPRLLCRSLNFGCSVSDRALFFLRVVCSATTSLRRLAGRRGVSISFEPRRMSKPLCAFTWGNWSSSERTWELKPTSRAEIRLFSIRDTAKTALDPDRYSKSRRGATARPSVTCSHTYSSSSSSDSRRTTASGDAGWRRGRRRLRAVEVVGARVEVRLEARVEGPEALVVNRRREPRARLARHAVVFFAVAAVAPF